MTADKLKELWFRNKAYLMMEPSIDREDNDGNYVYSNCRYIELSKNNIKDKYKIVLQFNLDGKFIREWSSATEVGRQLKIHQSHISQCCNGKRKTSGDFKWRFK